MKTKMQTYEQSHGSAATETVLDLSVFRRDEVLNISYKLSFGTLQQHSIYYLLLEGGHRQGLGEIIPLPGYSDETPESAEAELKWVATQLKCGVPARRRARSFSAFSQQRPWQALIYSQMKTDK